MSSAEKPDYVDVFNYLETEEASEAKHEYVNGWLRAMTGASNRHNVIATNTVALLWNALKGKRCQAFNSDTKVKIQRDSSTWFYYPDAVVVCEGNPDHESFQQSPVLVVEVLSRSTRAIDLDEKLNNYLMIPSLQYCLLLEQNKPKAILMRRTSRGFLRETYESLDSIIDLSAIECTLSLRDLYDRVDMSVNSIQEELVDYVTE